VNLLDLLIDRPQRVDLLSPLAPGEVETTVRSALTPWYRVVFAGFSPKRAVWGRAGNGRLRLHAPPPGANNPSAPTFRGRIEPHGAGSRITGRSRRPWLFDAGIILLIVFLITGVIPVYADPKWLAIVGLCGLAPVVVILGTWWGRGDTRHLYGWLRERLQAMDAPHLP
jgi:hypothetical protein